MEQDRKGLPVVSVVIPSYGSNTNPERAISSVLNQTYKSIEVIVVDDNGEGTPQQLLNEKIVSRFLLDPRFKYIVNKTNVGGSASRNIGANNSTGEYLCFLDDDDEFSDPDKVKKQMDVSVSLDGSYAGTYSSLIIVRGKKAKTIKANEKGRFLKAFFKGNTSIGTAAPIVRRDVFEKLNGFDESFVRHQDWEFFSRVLDNYGLMPVPTASYTRHYKMDVKRKPADVRLEYMDHFSEKMKNSITSVKKGELLSMIKRKYIQIVFAFLREKKIAQAFKVCKDNNYNLIDYLFLLLSMLKYVFHLSA